jgi:Tol biopolymer transport system component
MVTASFLFVSRSIYFDSRADVRFFSKITPLTSAFGYEYYAEPHPNGNHIVYVEKERDNYNLVMTDKTKNKWLVATSHFPWENLIWSASGDKLAASIFDQKQAHIFQFKLNLRTKKSNQQIFNLEKIKRSISSLNWLSDDILLMTAPNEIDQFFSYRFTLSKAELIQQSSNENTAIISKHNNLFAYVSVYKKRASIKVLSKDKQQQSTLITQWLDRDIPHDISWLPDGSGLLLLENNKMRILYLDGTEQELNYLTGNMLYRPRFSPDGKKIYVTQQEQSHDIWQISHQGKQTIISNSTYMDKNAKYSDPGKRIIYISNRSGSEQVWLNESNKERQLSSFNNDEKIESIHWDIEQKNILIKLSQQTLLLSLTSGRKTIINNQADHYPVSFSSTTKQYIYINADKDQRSVWSVNIDKPQNKQLLLTNINRAIGLGNHLYFQYVNQPGLWLKRTAETAILINKDVPAHSFFIVAEQKGVYFHDDDWYYLEFATNTRSKVLPDGIDEGWVSDIHPVFGWLTNKATTKERDIVMLQLK